MAENYIISRLTNFLYLFLKDQKDNKNYRNLDFLSSFVSVIR